MDSDRIKEKTARDVSQWISYIEEQAAKPIADISHKEIAQLVGAADVDDWWAQSIAVLIEQEIGRRVVGQTCRGTFSASASKTVAGNWLDVFAAFIDFMSQHMAELPAPAVGEPRISETSSWRYWRISLADETKIDITFRDNSSATQEKTVIGVSHDKLPSMAAREETKALWRKILNQFKESL